MSGFARKTTFSARAGRSGRQEGGVDLVDTPGGSGVPLRQHPLAPLAVNKAQAADLLGVSEDYLDEHVRPDIRVARVGRRVLIPVTELERWLDLRASRAV